ncbi:MAG: selenide, water dikinase SelD [Bacteroidetes bacterium]|nr:MAG: selenide, water dikinase SelD [Bacteroidota bacterium]
MNETELKQAVRLTQFSHGAGCGCKISPAVLDEILKGHAPQQNFANLLVGTESKDDAAILDLGNEECLISTTDFFTPIVDDAFDFGRIAAANAISDVYAMGGKPILALAILGFPVEKISSDIAREIIAGAKAICKEANIPLAGGHSIDSLEPIFGLSVNGLVKKKNIRRNNSAKNGDLLYLSKPIGTGIIGTALKRGKVQDVDLKKAVDVMTQLNSIGAVLSGFEQVHAITDVTGFGLLGHLIEICEGSGLSAEVNYKDIPLLPNLEYYMNQFIIPDNTYRNWNAFEKKVSGITGPAFIPLCDPQTSGGLLISVDPTFEAEMQKIDACFEKPIGRLFKATETLVSVIGAD